MIISSTVLLHHSSLALCSCSESIREVLIASLMATPIIRRGCHACSAGAGTRAGAHTGWAGAGANEYTAGAGAYTCGAVVGADTGAT